jgi:sarcosine oxidase subunit alpha
MTGNRLPERPGEVIDRGTSLAFTWNGQGYTGYQGDTIASALASSGVEVFARSMKYKRRRGIMTADHWDPNLFVQVGDEPNVRAGSRRLIAGMEVSAQNVWPSLKFDLGAANQMVGRFLSPGFYYKTFMRPKWFWHNVYQKVLRKFAPGGRIHWETSTHGAYDKRYAHPDVLVAGGGPAGMGAAIAAAEAGASVMLVEHEPELGGHLRWGGADDLAAIVELVSAVESHPGIEVLTDSTVTGRYDHNWIAVMQRSHEIAPERLIKARAASLVVAPGLIERPYIFAGNDTPGVMLSGAVRRLINLWAVKPGTKAVVLSANPEGEAVLADLDHLVDLVHVLGLAVGMHAHQLVLALVDLEAAVGRESRVEQAQGVGEAQLLDDLDLVAAPDPQGRGGPLTGTIHGEDGRFLEGRGEETGRGVGDVVVAEEQFRGGDAQALQDRGLDPELVGDPALHGLAEDGARAREGRHR